MIAPTPPPKMMLPHILAFVFDTTFARASEKPNFVHLTIMSLLDLRTITEAGVTAVQEPSSFFNSNAAPVKSLLSAVQVITDKFCPVPSAVSVEHPEAKAAKGLRALKGRFSWFFLIFKEYLL